MKLTPENKKIILEEFEFAIQKMKENKEPEQKLFYFSSTYGVISRIFNSKFDPQLAFIHMILNTVYINASARIIAFKGGDKTIKLPDDYFDKLAQITEELYAKLKNDENSYEILEKFALLTFLTTGNGYYLYERGFFNI